MFYHEERDIPQFYKPLSDMYRQISGKMIRPDSVYGDAYINDGSERERN